VPNDVMGISPPPSGRGRRNTPLFHGSDTDTLILLGLVSIETRPWRGFAPRGVHGLWDSGRLGAAEDVKLGEMPVAESAMLELVDDGRASSVSPGRSTAEAPHGGSLRDRDVRGVNTPAIRSSNRLARQIEADEDRELIDQAKQGNAAAFRRLVERHQRRAFAIAVGLVRDENDALEVVQEAFLRVYRSLESFHGGSSFFTWLYRIVSNLSIDLMRKPARREAELDEDQHLEDESEIPLLSRIDGSDPVATAERKQLAVRIQSALDALPPYHRGVILMREVEGMSYEEMAQAMGVSKGTIMSRLFHARQKLQRALGSTYLEEHGTRRTGGGP
jgi:RNA polymerase sigma-70 factor, ECF subfamily